MASGTRVFGEKTTTVTSGVLQVTLDRPVPKNSARRGVAIRDLFNSSAASQTCRNSRSVTAKRFRYGETISLRRNDSATAYRPTPASRVKREQRPWRRRRRRSSSTWRTAAGDTSSCCCWRAAPITARTPWLISPWARPPVALISDNVGFFFYFRLVLRFLIFLFYYSRDVVTCAAAVRDLLVNDTIYTEFLNFRRFRRTARSPRLLHRR